ncbi:MAG: hypothetical protein RO009_15725 [Pseudorhodoplanes sp.]|jgi:crossover junction endodeoxyribonuclease RuvC|nr:hypothetical protein [Pseudorhodoplanes sp.]
MNARCILGIDPGVTGGVAFYFPDQPTVIVAEDIPNVAGEVDADAFAARLKQMRPDFAVIERAGAMPGQGVSSTFKFGAAYGALCGVVAALGIPSHRVAPAVWKRHFKLDRDKEKSRALAVQLWPGAGCFSRKSDHGRAEAALIARWGAAVAFQAEIGRAAA